MYGCLNKPLQIYIKSMEYPPNCSRLKQQDLIIRELEEKTQKLGRQLKTVLKQIKAKERFPNHYPMKVQI